MLLLLNIFEDDQHDHSLSVDHVPSMGGHLAWQHRFSALVTCAAEARALRSTEAQGCQRIWCYSVGGCQRDLLDYCQLHPNQRNVSTN